MTSSTTLRIYFEDDPALSHLAIDDTLLSFGDSASDKLSNALHIHLLFLGPERGRAIELVEILHVLSTGKVLCSFGPLSWRDHADAFFTLMHGVESNEPLSTAKCEEIRSVGRGKFDVATIKRTLTSDALIDFDTACRKGHIGEVKAAISVAVKVIEQQLNLTGPRALLIDGLQKSYEIAQYELELFFPPVEKNQQLGSRRSLDSLKYIDQIAYSRLFSTDAGLLGILARHAVHETSKARGALLKLIPTLRKVFMTGSGFTIGVVRELQFAFLIHLFFFIARARYRAAEGDHTSAFIAGFRAQEVFVQFVLYSEGQAYFDSGGNIVFTELKSSGGLKEKWKLARPILASSKIGKATLDALEGAISQRNKSLLGHELVALEIDAVEAQLDALINAMDLQCRKLGITAELQAINDALLGPTYLETLSRTVGRIALEPHFI